MNKEIVEFLVDNYQPRENGFCKKCKEFSFMECDKFGCISECCGA